LGLFLSNLIIKHEIGRFNKFWPIFIKFDHKTRKRPMKKIWAYFYQI
jgi:hypothetical protein